MWLFREGAGAARISSVGEFSLEPVTDGVNVVYSRRVTTPPQGGTWELDRYDGTTTTVLAPESSQPWVRLCREQRVGGLYEGRVGRIPSGLDALTGGEERQLTFQGTGSGVGALGPNGRWCRYELHLPPYTGAPINLGAGSATAFVFTGGVLLKLVGNTVFTVTP